MMPSYLILWLSVSAERYNFGINYLKSLIAKKCKKKYLSLKEKINSTILIMNILLLGSGGREHAFAQKMNQSPLCSQLFVSPGNAGTAKIAFNIKLPDFQAIKQFCIDRQVKLVVVGPEQPLVDGIYDFFMDDDQLKNIPVIGPSKKGAMLEGSKVFCKQFLIKHHIPTAQYKEITAANIAEGYRFLEQLQAPYVLKANGLAAGKGVLICPNLNEAKTELAAMLEGKFGDASATVIIEEFMQGVEFSVFVLTDGKDYKILPVAKDYKRIGEGDTGLNTGGMGAISPPPFVDAAIMQTVEETIIKPTIRGFQEDDIVYKGFVYIGLMLTSNNIPKVVEYNCRMGDPETQAVFPRIKSDLVEAFMALANGNLKDVSFTLTQQVCAAVVLASKGYPEDFEKGKIITQLDDVKDACVFHAGTAFNEHNQIITNGGRVLAVSALADTLDEAAAIANKNAAIIQYDNKYYRKDIGG
jgi:phosphoribosylamine--glycine ligase